MVAQNAALNDGGTADPEIANQSGSAVGNLTTYQLTVFMARFSKSEPN
jgi:hypothetical protein